MVKVLWRHMWDGIKRLPLEVVEGVEEDAIGGLGV